MLCSDKLKHCYPNGFLRLPEVLHLIPVSEATWWNGCRTGRFPKGFKLTPRITAWRKQDILDLLDAFEKN